MFSTNRNFFVEKCQIICLKTDLYYFQNNNLKISETRRTDSRLYFKEVICIGNI